MSRPELQPRDHSSLTQSCADSRNVWHLACGEAVSLQARRIRTLRVVQGRVWVTTGGGQVAWLKGAGWPVSGDAVMRVGDVLEVPANTLVVVESWPDVGGQHAGLEWAEPAPVGSGSLLGGLMEWISRLIPTRVTKGGMRPMRKCPVH